MKAGFGICIRASSQDSELCRPIGKDRSNDVSGDPLGEPAARDWAVRDYRRYLEVVPKAAPTTINNTLAAIDDFYTRRSLGPQPHGERTRRPESPPAHSAPS